MSAARNNNRIRFVRRATPAPRTVDVQLTRRSRGWWRPYRIDSYRIVLTEAELVRALRAAGYQVFVP